MEASLDIYSDNEIEAEWFRNLHPVFESASFFKILARGNNPSHIEPIIEYDRPDIILVKKTEPVLVIEKTREVPTGHNVGQRVARLVKAVELGIPTIKFFPFDAKKHGEYANVCNLNIRLLLAFERMWAIHGTPIAAINWPADGYGELIDDESEDIEMKRLLSQFVIDNFSPSSIVFSELRTANKSEYEKRLKIRPQYGEPPPSVELVSTEGFLSKFSSLFTVDSSTLLNSRKETLIYTIVMTEAKCKRQDPYTGTQFIYDYAYCRSGPLPEQKHRNLVLYFPKITKSTWLQKNPNNPRTKSCNWYLVATALVFSDGAILLR